MKNLLLVFILIIISCKEKKKESTATDQDRLGDTITMDYAKGFYFIDYPDYKLLKVKNPAPDSDKTYTYLLSKRNVKLPKNIDYNQAVKIPLRKTVVTSTTHIPALEMLEETKSLAGFPHLEYISSEQTRNYIEQNNIAELGENEKLNIEVLLSLQPDAVIGFTIKKDNRVYENISKSGIPVIYNGDWTEENPLAKAEWIKFFGLLYDKEKESKSIFDTIKGNYLNAKKLIQKAKDTPTVITGGLFKDIWNLPKGDSWAAKFIEDAGGDYIYKDSKGTGSLNLSVEEVLYKAQDAEYWIAPGDFTSYDQMKEASKHYTHFDAFQNKKIYSYAGVTGDTGGVLYFELAPARPDLVLKDLIHIFHPEILPDYKTSFYKPLE